MEYFLAFLTATGIAFIYINRNYFKSFFNDDNEYEGNKNNPPFCFECNYSECYECEPLELWKNGNKKEAWNTFMENEMFK